MKVKQLIQKLLDMPLDKDIKIVTPDNCFLLIDYVKHNDSQNIVEINSQDVWGNMNQKRCIDCNREMKFSVAVYAKDIKEGNELNAGWYCPVCEL